MKYTVDWTDAANDELAAAWLVSTDRNGLSQDVHSIEVQLAFDPFVLSESRDRDLERITFGGQSVVWYDIIPDDNKVLVTSFTLR